MTTTLTLQIVGETWHNQSEIIQQLESLPPEQDIIIDVNSEGPALAPFGVFELLKKYSHNYSFTKWSNPVEPSPYPRFKCSETSHFFRLSWRYWVNEIENKPAKNTFGLFIGRNSVSRNCILYDVSTQWPEHFLLSKMSTPVADIWEEQFQHVTVQIDLLEDWTSPGDQVKIKQWWESHPIPSIDNRTVRDQYGVPEINAANCALSLLSHYDKFNIELICESYTRGTTFFPTEKTVRPVIGNKPFLVYGPVNYLTNLQNLGFKTFNTWWDESYDSYEGPARWQAMRSIIDTICQWDDAKKQEVLFECSQVTQHNRTRLRELINDYKEF